MLDRAKEVIRIEASALRALADRLDGQICIAADWIYSTPGLVVVSGVGKSQIVGEKISATLASTGTPSITLDPTDAMHGDLGRLGAGDVLLALTNSGETAELKRLVLSARAIGTPIIVLTGNPGSSIAALADVVVDVGNPPEACPFSLAPTSSTTAMMALGDALAMIVLEKRGFTREDFGRLHPAGSLGQRLMRVRDVMRTGERMPTVPSGTSLGAALLVMTMTPGHAGAVMVTGAKTGLRGIVTAQDLRQLLNTRGSGALGDPVEAAMDRQPATARAEWLVEDAVARLTPARILHAPVVDEAGALVGLLDLGDVGGTVPTSLPLDPETRLSVA